MILDGVSAHCPIWVHTTAWTGSPTIRPFIPEDVAKKSPEEIEAWAENYLLKLLDLLGELKVKVLRCSGASPLAGKWQAAIRGASGLARATI
jgi:hypothetical protein